MTLSIHHGYRPNLYRWTQFHHRNFALSPNRFFHVFPPAIAESIATPLAQTVLTRLRVVVRLHLILFKHIVPTGGKKAAKNLAGWRSWSLAASSKIASSTRCRWWVICTIKWPWKTEAQEAGLRYWDVAKGPEGCNPRQTCLIFSWITLLPSIFPGIQTTYPDHLLSVDWNINFLG